MYYNVIISIYKYTIHKNIKYNKQQYIGYRLQNKIRCSIVGNKTWAQKVRLCALCYRRGRKEWWRWCLIYCSSVWWPWVEAVWVSFCFVCKWVMGRLLQRGTVQFLSHAREPSCPQQCSFHTTLWLSWWSHFQPCICAGNCASYWGFWFHVQNFLSLFKSYSLCCAFFESW